MNWLTVTVCGKLSKPIRPFSICNNFCLKGTVMGPFGSSIKQPTLHFYTMVVPEVFSMSEGIALPVIGTIVFCTIGLYLLKYFQAEVNVPVRDSTKTHNWKAIRVAARVRESNKTTCFVFSVLIGMVLFYV